MRLFVLGEPGNLLGMSIVGKKRSTEVNYI